MLGKNWAGDILKYFPYFSQTKGIHVSRFMQILEANYMKCENLFSGKKQQNIIVLLSAELPHRVVDVNPSPAEPG